MLKKTFIMLAAPGMIGKSTAAQAASKPFPIVHVLENDKLMQKLFETVRLPKNLPINKTDEWRAKVNERACCDRLIRLLHRDEVSLHREKSVILAEGYTYMERAYREQVKIGLDRLKYKIDYLLLRFQPNMEIQVRNRDKKHTDYYNWHSISPDEHERHLDAEWAKFEEPAPSENLLFETVDEVSLVERIKQVVLLNTSE